MPIYSYKAINETGGRESGALEAESPDAVGNILAGRGLIPLKISEKESIPLPPAMMLVKDKLLSVKAQDLIVFTKQFKTMTKAGVPTLKLLKVLENQTENKKLKKIASSMSRDITSGESLFNAFKKIKLDRLIQILVKEEVDHSDKLVQEDLQFLRLYDIQQLMDIIRDQSEYLEGKKVLDLFYKYYYRDYLNGLKGDYEKKYKMASV